ncbi:MAG: hypothetical protein WC149_01685 [Arcobacteraceae bacterium]
MIFILLILFIAVIVIGLNMVDNSNLDKIRSYLEAKNCTHITYGYGSYKALCQEDVTVVENSFTLDIQKNQNVIKYDTIVQSQQKNQKVIVTLDNDRVEVLEFKDKNDATQYYEKIEEKR